MKNLAIIPARGGSKRIPGKNIKPFLGKPIIAYSIELALRSKLFEEVMVSTDSQVIADIATQCGATVPFTRSSTNANDLATLADVVDEVRSSYLKQNCLFNHICCILPTAPLLTIKNLKKGYVLLHENRVDSVRPVVRFSYPIQRALKMHDGQVEMFCPEHQQTRSQDLEPAFHDAGQFYWMRFENGLRGADRMGFEINEMLAQDIDSLEDWKMAEIKFRINNQLK